MVEASKAFKAILIHSNLKATQRGISLIMAFYNNSVKFKQCGVVKAAGEGWN